MTVVWEALDSLQEHFEEKFNKTGVPVRNVDMDRFNQPNWFNRHWTSIDYRLAHISVVDAREEKRLWMMHCCIFPETTNDGPIFGFDVVAGPNKMTGAFHDFSPTTNLEHDMMGWFEACVKELKWERERELPEWAKQIFSNNMLSAGNVREEKEVKQLSDLIKTTLDYYLKNIGSYKGYTTEELGIAMQNRYAHYQKQNPHTPRVMKSLGLNEDDVDCFISTCLFPEIR